MADQVELLPCPFITQRLPLAPERITASLDAALALVPVCPMTGGDRYAVTLDSGFYGATAELWHECSLNRIHGHAGGQHEALARALCRPPSDSDRSPQGGDLFGLRRATARCEAIAQSLPQSTRE